MGNTLTDRLVRASVKSITAAVQLPMYLSPWVDKHPVTLPITSHRDAVLAAVGHFGAEALTPRALELTAEVHKFGAVQAAVRTADDDIHDMASDKAAAVSYRKRGRSTETNIKHKLKKGSDAQSLICRGTAGFASEGV